jgi:NADH-quinone oxidoreductase subunit J
MLDSVIFTFFGGIAVLSAVMMITRRHAMHSAVFLIITLLATSGIFLQLRAEFLFIAQIILFVGGVMALFLCVIALVPLDALLPRIRSPWRQWTAVSVAVVVFLEVAIMIGMAKRNPGQGLLALSPVPADKLPPNTEDLAKSLFSAYLLPFEITSLLLLLAMVQAVVMAKKRADAP